MNYSILYPSGRRFELRGEFSMLNVPRVGLTPMIDEGAGGTSYLLDPRAVVTEYATGVVVYSIDMLPRDELTQDMRRGLHATEESA